MGTLSIGTLKILTPFSWLWRHFRRTPQKESSSEPIAGDVVDEILQQGVDESRQQPIHTIYYRTPKAYFQAVSETTVLGEYDCIDGRRCALCDNGATRLVYKPFEEEE